MKNLAPQIFRKRLIIEALYDSAATITISRVTQYLKELSVLLDMTIVHGPLVNDWAHKAQPNKYAGLEAWAMWCESGVQLYVWENKAKLLTVDIFTCKDFDHQKALTFTQQFFHLTHIEHMTIPTL